MYAIRSYYVQGYYPEVEYLERSWDSDCSLEEAIVMYTRHFHPAYLDTLKLALESPEPVLRVQAAAVAAHDEAVGAAPVEEQDGLLAPGQGLV